MAASMLIRALLDKETMEDQDEGFERELKANHTCIHFVGCGLPASVNDVVSNPSRFGFEVAIHLHLLVLWGTQSNRRLQRSIAEQLGMMDKDDTRALLDRMDEDDNYKGVEEEKRRVVGELSKRIHSELQNKRCLLVLENVPDEGWDDWWSMGVTFPTDFNGGLLVLSSYRRLADDGLPKMARRRYFELVETGGRPCPHWLMSPKAQLDASARILAVSLRKMWGIVVTAEQVFSSLWYWWLFKPYEAVPVVELVNFWVHAEFLLPPSSSPTTAGGATVVEGAPPRSLEVGKALLQEACRQYLVKVSRGGDHGWCREPLAVEQALRIGTQEGSLCWMLVSPEKRTALWVAYSDGTVVPLSKSHLAYAFLRGSSHGRPKRVDVESLIQGKAGDGLRHTMLIVARTDATPNEQPANKYDLRYVHIIPDDFFVHMPSLRLLDLSYTNISSLPDSFFFFLPELRVLLLRGCRRLKTLAAPTGAIQHRRGALNKLRVLDLSNSSVREISDDVLLLYMTNLEELLLCQVDSLTQLPTLRSLEKLRVFRLTHTSLGGPLPEELFQCTSLLRVLDLSHNHSIKSLPKSLSTALSTLEEIHLHGCTALEHVDFWDGQHMPNLKVFTLSGSAVICRLSLRGCSRLETIELSDLGELEMLDLSGTGIKELPVGILNLPRLRHLNLLGVGKLRIVPWTEAKKIPTMLNLNQCSCTFIGGRAIEEEDHSIGRESQIFVVDPRILDHRFRDAYFSEFKPNADFIREQLPCFHLRISPCNHLAEEEPRRCPKVNTRHVPRSYRSIPVENLIRRGVNHHDDDRLQRHVDVHGGGDVFLPAAFMFMLAADSLSLRDNQYSYSLSDINPHYRLERRLYWLDNFWNLRRCRLERCHNMQYVIDKRTSEFTQLESLWISKLPRLTRAWDPYLKYTTTAFGNLRYVHLEYCPNIISVFPEEIHLNTLEKIVIKSCPRLRQVFHQVSLSGLTTMELLDLPNLESIGRDIILSPKATWKLRVRGCWKLRELPTFHNETSVEIDCEPMW